MKSQVFITVLASTLMLLAYSSIRVSQAEALQVIQSIQGVK